MVLNITLLQIQMYMQISKDDIFIKVEEPE